MVFLLLPIYHPYGNLSFLQNMSVPSAAVESNQSKQGTTNIASATASVNTSAASVCIMLFVSIHNYRTISAHALRVLHAFTRFFGNGNAWNPKNRYLYVVRQSWILFANFSLVLSWNSSLMKWKLVLRYHVDNKPVWPTWAVSAFGGVRLASD
jgi:hypothetical protein